MPKRTGVPWSLVQAQKNARPPNGTVSLASSITGQGLCKDFRVIVPDQKQAAGAELESERLGFLCCPAARLVAKLPKKGLLKVPPQGFRSCLSVTSP